jgi:hypothetical protein
MQKPQFDGAYPDSALVRRVVLQRLLKDPSWEHLDDDNAKSFEPFLTFDPPRPDDRQVFGRCLLDVFWQFVAEGVL